MNATDHSEKQTYHFRKFAESRRPWTSRTLLSLAEYHKHSLKTTDKLGERICYIYDRQRAYLYKELFHWGMKTPIEKWRQDLADWLRVLKWGWHMKRWSTPLKTREANLNNMWYPFYLWGWRKWKVMTTLLVRMPDTTFQQRILAMPNKTICALNCWPSTLISRHLS